MIHLGHPFGGRTAMPGRPLPPARVAAEMADAFARFLARLSEECTKNGPPEGARSGTGIG